MKLRRSNHYNYEVSQLLSWSVSPPKMTNVIAWVSYVYYVDSSSKTIEGLFKRSWIPALKRPGCFRNRLDVVSNSAQRCWTRFFRCGCQRGIYKQTVTSQLVRILPDGHNRMPKYCLQKIELNLRFSSTSTLCNALFDLYHLAVRQSAENADFLDETFRIISTVIDSIINLSKWWSLYS